MKTIYDAVVEEMGFDPPMPVKVPQLTKRDKHRAGKLTGEVWDALGGTGPIEVSGVMVYPIGYGEEVK